MRELGRAIYMLFFKLRSGARQKILERRIDGESQERIQEIDRERLVARKTREKVKYEMERLEYESNRFRSQIDRNTY